MQSDVHLSGIYDSPQGAHVALTYKERICAIVRRCEVSCNGFGLADSLYTVFQSLLAGWEREGECGNAAHCDINLSKHCLQIRIL
jgi:hypothetical protein